MHNYVKYSTECCTMLAIGLLSSFEDIISQRTLSIYQTPPEIYVVGGGVINCTSALGRLIVRCTTTLGQD